MYETIQILHSYWAYLVLLILTLATFNALFKLIRKKEFNNNDLRISLFALVVVHIQLVIGLILYFVSPLGLESIKVNGMGGLTSFARQVAVEHPFVGILGVIFITIGFSKHKKKLTAAKKFKTITIFYMIAWLLILSRIPWSIWFN
jgi:heme A synthase